MSTLAWNILELLVFIMDIVGAQWYMHMTVGEQEPRRLRLAAGGAFLFAVLAFCYFDQTPETIRMLLLLMSSVMYALFVLKGSNGYKLFQVMIAFVVVMISDAVAIALITLLPGVTLNMVLAQTPSRLQAMVLAKAFFFALIAHIATRKSWKSGRLAQWIVAIAIPVISLIILTVMFQYESEWNSKNSFGLVGLAIGLFIVNIALIALNEQLTKSGRMLLEKEKLLQLSDIQSRYFNEVLTSNDNMKGFRHDLGNHLQVLNGLLEMGRVAEAREYLHKIGDYVGKNDLSVNCGYPLIDAVMGSKLAMAKKLDIAVGYTIVLEKDIPIPQLEICSLLGNTLDNALEACERLTEGCERRVELSLTSENGAIRYEIENTCPQEDQGATRPRKDKHSELPHGLGLANIRRIVQERNGTLDIRRQGCQFHVSIRLPVA